RRLVQGDAVSYPVSENSDRELAVGLAAFVRAPLSQVAEFLASGDLIVQDSGVTAYGAIAEPAALSALRFSGSERDEAEGLVAASPGSRFNLSTAEIEALQSLRASIGGPGRSSMVDLVSEEYRKLLRLRWQAYQQAGLAGIAPYARGGGAVMDPAGELRSAAGDADRVGGHGAELHAALLGYPVAQPPGVVSRCYWTKRQILHRPAFSLIHQMSVGEADLVIEVERYFYVGHSYNAGQIITGAVAYQDGVLVFATSRFSTDEVLGVGNQLKRAMGRRQLGDEMRRRLDRLRSSVVSFPGRSPSVQGP
ncbi:MAG TPA: hypothetical protein VEL75_14860, partial [Candidatus Methylomirabilis sp.]|nr:hypothetical protein [Candidatus Methylomirabilis sp.]